MDNVDAKKIVRRELKLTCKSFVLSPNDARQSFTQGNNVFVLRGSVARNFLMRFNSAFATSPLAPESKVR